MEARYRCTGFCHHPAPASAAQASAARRRSLLRPSRRAARGARPAVPSQQQRLYLETDEAPAEAEASAAPESAVEYAPALFSTANLTSSCDGAAARHMINFTRNIAYQMWYMGIILILLNVCIGLWEATSEGT